MNTSRQTLFDGARLTMAQAIDLTVASLREYGARHDIWAIAYSGGKDSTALLALVVHLIEAARVPRPRRLHVLYCDTRMELPPLQMAAMQMLESLRTRDWIDARVVMAEMDQRYFVYMLGRGVPPPNNNTLRWCTAQIKVEPMEQALRTIADRKLLMLLGVRIGESAARDQRIAIACSKNGAECGQGWYQQELPDALCDKLSPLLHWRACHVWDWLMWSAPDLGFPTSLVAEAYGIDEEGSVDELNARTGCVGCPLATKETALDQLLHNPAWSYLAPLKDLRPIYRELRQPRNRLRQPGGEARKDGSLIANQNRMGPLVMDARRWAMRSILRIQREVNLGARRIGRPEIDILNVGEVRRIRDLWRMDTWPNGWTGKEPIADMPYEDFYADGSRQLLLDNLRPGKEGSTPCK